MTIYCTYLTVYTGNKMPQFYIGSSNEDKINCGYRGSVSSKMYGNIWKTELKQNPQLFKTYVITRHATREEALEKEDYFHKFFKVMSNPMYINRSRAIGLFGSLVTTKETREKMSLASKGKPKTEQHRLALEKANRIKAQDPEFRKKLKKKKHKGFGEKVSKALLGVKKTEEHCKNISKALRGIKRSPMKEEVKLNISKSLKGKENPNKNKTYEEIYGEERAKELKLIRSKAASEIAKNSPIRVCPHCGKSIKGYPNYSRYHGDNCKINPNKSC